MTASELIAEKVQWVRAGGRNDKNMVPSPCISVCRMDAVTGLCEGCFRTLEEIGLWSGMDDARRRAAWEQIAQRVGA